MPELDRLAELVLAERRLAPRLADLPSEFHPARTWTDYAKLDADLTTALYSERLPGTY